MGNDLNFDFGNFLGSGGNFRSGWKPVSDRAYNDLEKAKDRLRHHIKTYSFENIPNASASLTMRVIQMHLVGKLRPRFNDYAKQLGTKPKWIKLTEFEKKQTKKYKTRKSAVFFCDVTIYKNTFNNLMIQEPQSFKNEFLIAEISLFNFLTINFGVPEMEAIGWIIEIPKNVSKRVEKIPKIKDLNKYLDEQKHVWSKIMVETIKEYNEKPIIAKQKKKRKSIKKNTFNLMNNNNNIDNEFKELFRGRKKFRMSLFDSDDDSESDLEIMPAKKRRLY